VLLLRFSESMEWSLLFHVFELVTAGGDLFIIKWGAAFLNALDEIRLSILNAFKLAVTTFLFSSSWPTRTGEVRALHAVGTDRLGYNLG
jgi:hypothetical protein